MFETSSYRPNAFRQSPSLTSRQRLPAYSRKGGGLAILGDPRDEPTDAVTASTEAYGTSGGGVSRQAPLRPLSLSSRTRRVGQIHDGLAKIVRIPDHARVPAYWLRSFNLPVEELAPV